MFKFWLPLFALCFVVSCDMKEQNQDKNQVNETEQDSTITEDTEEGEITEPEATEVWDPEPAVITFNEKGAPSDAIVLFNGENLDAWKSTTDTTKAASWTVNKDGSFTVRPKSGDIETKQSFGDIQLHIEWRAPQEITGESQGRGNSGIFFQKRYEVQVLDSYDNRTYSNGQATAIYKQSIPLVNATKAPSEWQTYDIIYHEPKFNDDGKKVKSGTFTVLHNGVVTQDHVELQGTTEYIGKPKNTVHGTAPLELQDHGNLVSYRNIWLREL